MLFIMLSIHFMLQNRIMDSNTTSRLFRALIFTPVNFPSCFAGTGPVKKNLDRNGLDPNVVANAIARFLILPEIKYLYIAGNSGSHACLFFEDLSEALKNEPEINICSDSDFLDLEKDGKFIIRQFGLSNHLPTSATSHVVLQFRNTNRDFYLNFAREHLAAFVYCGNSEQGPLIAFECRSKSGIICVRRRFTNLRTCGVCFWVQEKSRLGYVTMEKTAPKFNPEDYLHCPLRVPPYLFTDYFSDTDTEPVPENDPQYDSETDY